MQGIERQQTAADTPSQNGVAERLNRTLQERVTAMMADTTLAPSFWGEAVNAYMAVHNVCPSSATPDSTPHVRWHGQVPDISQLRAFGCPAFVLIPKGQHKNRSQSMVNVDSGVTEGCSEP